MSWQIVFYESARGDRLVEDFIVEQLDISTQDKIRQLFDLVEDNGLSLGLPHIRYLRGSLWEMRIAGKVAVRIIFVVQVDKIILLNAFKKKSKRTPPKEIATALKRWRSLLDS